MTTPDWKGLFDWSMKYQDGTNSGAAKEMKAEDRAWFSEAMQHYTMDFVKRMQGIKATLDNETAETDEAVHEKEQLLDELMEIVEHIDHARDLTKIGGLDTLLALLKSSHASLRSRAAEVAAVCTQINPPVQLWFMQGGALPKLMELLEDSDATCRQKGLLAISCLIRNNPEGLSAFETADGVAKLVKVVNTDVPKVQRKAVQLLTHIAQETPTEISAAKIAPSIVKLCLTNGQESDLREAALGFLLQLAKHPDTHAEMTQVEGVPANLQQRWKEIEDSPTEDRSELEEERAQLGNLIHALQNPDFSQRQQASQGADGPKQEEKKEPLLLGPPQP